MPAIDDVCHFGQPIAHLITSLRHIGILVRDGIMEVDDTNVKCMVHPSVTPEPLLSNIHGNHHVSTDWHLRQLCELITVPVAGLADFILPLLAICGSCER